MKKAHYLIWVLVLIFAACKKEIPSSYTINGYIEGAKDGDKLELVLQNSEFFLGEQKKIIDTATIKDGKFTFTGKLKTPELHYIVFAEPEKKKYERVIIPIFFENANIKISAKKEDFKSLQDFYNLNYNLDAIKIEGSKTYTEYISYLKNLAPIKTKEAKLWEENTNNFKAKRKLSVSEGIELANRFEAVWKEKNAFFFNFVKNNINSTLGQYVGYYSIMSNAKYDKAQLNEINSLLTKTTDTFPGLKVLKENIITLEKIAPGSTYIDLPFKDKDGNALKLSDYVGKGKYILLEFWASWCGPCRMDIPHLKEVYKLYGHENFDIISVSMDSKHEDWLKAIEEEQMTWLQVSDGEAFSGDLAKKYQILGIPACFLIDPDGNIVTDNMRGSYMDKRLIEMYGNKFNDK